MSERRAGTTHLTPWRIYFDRALAREALGDLVILAEEAPTVELQVEAHRLLGQRLLHRRRLQLAREQGLAIMRIKPSDEIARRLVAQVEAEKDQQGSPPPAATSATGDANGERVVLFSGHMIDAPGRETPRFPPEKESIAEEAIAATLSRLRVGPRDLAICGGACGGDTLFAEACLARGLHVHIHLQFDEPEFLAASVAFAGQPWIDRYHRLAAHPLSTVRIMPQELGPAPAETNPYERNNLWQLYSALAARNVQFIALWNGQGGDGPGGTKHMVKTVERHAGHSTILNTTELW